MKEKLIENGLKIYGIGIKSNIFEINDPMGKVLILKPDIITYLGINRKTLNTMISRSEGKTKIYKDEKGNMYLNIVDVLKYVGKHFSRKNINP
ncbi:MAG: hypothetical protein AB7E37_05885 [Candidatus Altimarinota bacterium]